MIIPPRLRRVKKCERCELLFSYNEMSCTHCKGLSEQQVVALKQKYADEHEGNANLGKLFFIIAMLLLLALFIINSG